VDEVEEKEGDTTSRAREASGQEGRRRRSGQRWPVQRRSERVCVAGWGTRKRNDEKIGKERDGANQGGK